MASTTFVDKTTIINTSWLNDVNNLVWTVFNGATTAALARTAMGLGSMALQTSSAVAITGGTITGTTVAGYATTGLATASGLTQNTSKLLGRTTASAGAIEEISVTVGSGSFSAGALVLPTVPAIAAQSDQETGTSVVTIVTPGRQQFHPSAAKGWVQFDAAVNIGSSYNVSGMTDTGVGNWTISWNVDFSSANFTVAAAVQQSQAGASTTLCLQIATGGLAAGTTQLLLTDVSTTARDATFIHCVAFGDQ